MKLRLDSPLVRLYRRAYVEDRAWLVALGLTPQVDYVPEDVRRQIRVNVPDLEARMVLFRDWLVQENDRLNTEAAEACYEQMEKGRLSLCPFFWKTMAGVFVYGLVYVPSRAVINFLDQFLFSPVINARESTINWFQRIFTRQVLVSLCAICATVLLLLSLTSGFWGMTAQFGDHVVEQFRFLGHELSEEASRNQAAKARLAEEAAKAQVDAQVRAESEQAVRQIWTLAYPEQAEAEALALRQAADKAAQAKARQKADEARWRAQAKAEEWRAFWGDVKDVGIFLGACVLMLITGILVLVAAVWFLDFLDKAVDLVLSLFVLVCFINYPKFGDGLGTLVDGIWDFGRMCWGFAKAVKARACPLLQFQ